MPATDLLTTLQAAKAALGITASDPSYDTLLNQLIFEMSAIIIESLGRTVFFANNASNPITQFPVAMGAPELFLRDRPVQCPLYTGTTTTGSAILTAMSSVTYLFANQCVSGPGIPSGSYISSVGSTTVTLNQAATASASGVTLLFGVAVWSDATGYYGAGPSAFASTSMLFEGQDYLIRRDQEPGSSRSAILDRIRGGWDQDFRTSPPYLSAYGVPRRGSIKVQYVAGFPSLPGDIEVATLRVIAKARSTSVFGQILQTESYEGGSYNLAPLSKTISAGLLDGDVAPILGRYRNSGLIA